MIKGSGKAHFNVNGFYVEVTAVSTAEDGGYAPNDRDWYAIAQRLWQLVHKTTDKPVTPGGEEGENVAQSGRLGAMAYVHPEGEYWVEGQKGPGHTQVLYVNRGGRCLKIGYWVNWGLSLNVYGCKADGSGDRNYGSWTAYEDQAQAFLVNAVTPDGLGEDAGPAR